FVSYYDYYQPEAYIARSDTYIEKDSSRNEEIDRMRHSATRSLFERRDVIIVASVSCIYGLGAPVDYGAVTVRLKKGERVRRDKIDIYPARHFVTPREKLLEAIKDIEVELVDRVKELEDAGRLLEAQRLRQRTNFDLEMLRETGTCAGVENYSRHLARRPAGSR